MRRGIATVAAALLAAMILAACGGKQQWQTTNITGVMPNLKFTLTDGSGQVVHANAYRDKVKLLYFGFTHCPDVCPLTLATIGRALKKIGPDAKQAVVLFVSVDPKRDTPDVLKQYVAAFGPQFIGLTGTQPQLKALTKRYRVSYSYDKPDAQGNYNVNHSAAVFVFDRDGKVRLLMNRTDGANEMAHDLRQLIES